MRLSAEHALLIRAQALELAGAQARVRLYGSRLHDHLRGGDVDLLLELPSLPANPALLAAQLAGRVSRALHGRKVDVLIDAPGLKQLPIHQIARSQGVLL